MNDVTELADGWLIVSAPFALEQVRVRDVPTGMPTLSIDAQVTGSIPEVAVYADTDREVLTPNAARRFADALRQAADAAERMSGGSR
ncbi:hypothetical protein NONO_c73260 [Nocardia nova SH22a]|uniref:Uncharacterized protein n=1 Tax=Nocardia nova SH22a TaxID=1415166 RepID=W5TS25_9NOCA|nr:hypothetical protein [Nocardia nova]AHH22082.1 hypothetical protein NONO_c73260 [Nocardia nova SH22a]